MATGCSFYSSSVEAVESGDVDLSCYNLVDIVLGKQKTTTVGRGAAPKRYKCFSERLQSVVTSYLNSKGALFVSGAYIGTDLLGNGATAAAQTFAAKALHISFMGGNATSNAVVSTASRMPSGFAVREYNFCRDYRPDYYKVGSVDGFAPASGGKAIIRYTDSALAAAIGYKGEDCSTFVMGFPFESIIGEQSRDLLMKDIVEYLIH